MTGRKPVSYTLKNVEDMLGLGRSVISSLISAGFVSPTRGPRNEYRFGFQDLVLLRTAHQLRSARIPTRRLLAALKQLSDRLPEEMPLTGLRIRAVGNEIAVLDGASELAVESGQFLLDFQIGPTLAKVSTFRSASSMHETRVVAPTANDLYRLGRQLEGTDKPGAEKAYRDALALCPGHASAAVNLGALLCDSGRFEEAIACFRRGITLSPRVALLHFNLGIALEQVEAEGEALAHYEQALVLDPELADAHFNAARICEKIGERQNALRHYSAYRRLERGTGP